jgi:hypothetical protein
MLPSGREAVARGGHIDRGVSDEWPGPKQGNTLVSVTAVEASEELAEAALVGGLAAGEAQGVGQGLATVTAELGDGLQALAAGQEGDDGEGEDGRQRVTPPLA